MSDLGIFYSSMSSVMKQWNDFSTSKNLYKAYFNMQSAQTQESSANQESYIQKLINGSTEKLSPVSDKLSTLSGSLSDSVSKLEKAFTADSETGETDMNTAYSAAESFVESYNKLSEGIKSSGNSTVSGKSQFITNMTNAYSYKLQKAGITANADGSLSIDKEKFMAADEKSIDQIFGKKDSFAQFMSKQAEQLSAYAQTDLYRQASSYSAAGNITNIANISGSYFSILG
ncbi:MAG: hypothetical protein ACI4KR_03430 [Ruminiclostridium sp.]